MTSIFLQPLAGPRLLAATCAAGLLVGLVLAAGAPGLPMVWDEGNAIRRAEQIPAAWPYTIREEGHPAFYGMVIAAGSRMGAGWVEPLTAARLGPMLLFTLAAAAVFYRLARHFSRAAAVVGTTGLVLMPRLFAHAHFATCDGPLVACWLLSAVAFWPAWEGHGARALAGPGSGKEGTPRGFASLKPRPPGLTQAAEADLPRCALIGPRVLLGGLLFGALLGMTFSSKATGLLAVIPPLAWLVVYRGWHAAATFAVGLVAAAVTFFVLNPPLWTQPISGTAEFLDLNLHRAGRLGLNIPVRFLGQIHHVGNPLPWYNTLLWTAVTVPVGLLALAVLGMFAAWTWRRSQPAGVFIWLSWAVLVVVRAIPGTPVHDGVRLFLPSFGFLASAQSETGGRAGGAGQVAAANSSGPYARRAWVCRWAALGAVVLALAGSASSLILYAPQWLSYYNLLIGGLPGAARLGMEPTYYWDGLDRQTLDWLNENTAAEERIAFAPISPDNLELLRQWGRLRREAVVAQSLAAQDTAAGPLRWYVIQRRPSAYGPADRLLLGGGRPAFTRCIRYSGFGPWRLDVPLVQVYAWKDFQKAREATAAVGR